MPEDIINSKSKFLSVLLICCVVCITSMIYFFYFKQDFNFIVETSCDPTTQTCRYRDCTLPDAECPPNNYSYYKVYDIKASDFKYCSNEDCQSACEGGVIQCQEQECTNDDIDAGICTVPEPPEIIPTIINKKK